MLDNALIGLIALFAIIRTPNEMRVLIVFSGMCTLMLFVGTYIQDNYIHYNNYYYLLCALSHLFIINRINKEHKITRVIFHLTIINLAFIYLNLFGLSADFTYIMRLTGAAGIDYYNVVCEVLYSLVLTTMIYNWCCDGIWRTRIYRVISFLRSNMRSSISQLQISEGEKGA